MEFIPTSVPGSAPASRWFCIPQLASSHVPAPNSSTITSLYPQHRCVLSTAVVSERPLLVGLYLHLSALLRLLPLSPLLDLRNPAFCLSLNSHLVSLLLGLDGFDLCRERLLCQTRFRGIKGASRGVVDAHPSRRSPIRSKRT